MITMAVIFKMVVMVITFVMAIMTEIPVILYIMMWLYDGGVRKFFKTSDWSEL